MIENFKNILNPVTNKTVKIISKEGLYILKKYNDNLRTNKVVGGGDIKFNTLVIQKYKKFNKQQIITSKSDWNIINENYMIYDENNKLKAVFLKKIIPKELILIGREELQKYKAKTTLRLDSAGFSNYMTPKNGDPIRKMANPVNSAVVGFYERNNFYPCRQTILYKKHKKSFNKRTIKLIQHISNIFKKYCREQYNTQNDYIKKINPYMRLKGTVFTTLTVNQDFRTRSHYDKGDYSEGFSNLSVYNIGNFTGGELLFPEYKMGFNVQEGDLIFFDSHFFLHCNNPIKGTGRISLICYIREKIKNNCKGVNKKIILEGKKFKRDPLKKKKLIKQQKKKLLK